MIRKDHIISAEFQPQHGKVIFAGAGPGDPELLTLKSARHLQLADVVLVDRLVSEEILSTWVKPEATIIHVGKQKGKSSSTPQSEINQLLVDFAAAGKYVVRLKGGDVSIFSNIMDELFALKAAGICYEIVPGVTAALGAAAYAGIPLTARNYSTGCRFLTYYESKTIDALRWKELASCCDTLVFYMSSDLLHEAIALLLENGAECSKPIALIEQATTEFQQVHISTISQFHSDFSNAKFKSPSLVIIGDVVNLHREFNWFESSRSDNNYFRPLAKFFKTDFTKKLKPNQHVTRA